MRLIPWTLQSGSEHLFWSAGLLSAAQWTTEIIADQQTGKNTGPALADYQSGASAIPLSCIFWPIFKNISKRRNYQIMGVDTDNDTAE
jgi:hypothetical protein